MKATIRDLTIDAKSSVKDALTCINNSGLGACFVCEASDLFVGLVTDGDIRRFLLNGGLLADSVLLATNTKCLTLSEDSPHITILKHFSNGIHIIPLTNLHGNLVDYASPPSTHPIPVLAPDLSGNELLYVSDCVNSSWISSQGKYVSEFESLFSSIHLDLPALAVSNGTVALHLALKTLPLTPGDEVIVPNLTFASCINVIIEAGLTPVLCDIDPINWCLSLDHILDLITIKTKAVMAVHLYGNCPNLASLCDLCNDNNLFLIEDCAEAIGTTFNDLPVGTFGDIATFSFFGNKTITTGEGGMLLFKGQDLFHKAIILRDHGMSKNKRYWHEVVGFNYRMTNMQAAIGLAQLERFNEIVQKKHNLMHIYSSLLAGSPYVEALPSFSVNVKHSNWLYTILLSKFIHRDRLLENLYSKGIECRRTFYPLSVMPPYQGYSNSSYPVSIALSDRGICLPSSVGLSSEEVQYIVSCFIEACKICGI